MAVGRQDWAEIAAAWELSGERQSAFAARHGVHVETLRSWIYRLRRQRPAKRSKIVEVRVSPATAPTGTSLTEIAADAREVELDATQLAMLLDGIDVGRVKRPAAWVPAKSA